MNIKTLLRSFAGGEISPELHSRLDLTKNQTGLKTARNIQITPHGPAMNRAGWQYVLEVKDSTKKVVLLPFIFNSSQSYVLEFGDQYMRIHTLAATVLETGLTITGITNANPGVLTYTGSDPSNGDWMYLSAIGGMTELNGRYVKVANVNAGANTFELTSIHGGANINTTSFGTYTAGGTAARVYEITTPYLEADLFDLHFTQSADVLTIVHPSYQQRELRRLAATNWTLSTFTLAPTISAPSQPTGATGGPGGGTPINHFYKTTAIASDGLEESLGSTPSAGVAHDLTVAGNYIDVDPTPGGATVSGAVRYNVYKLSNGLYGYIGQTDGSTFRDNNVTPDVSKTPPEAEDPFASSSNYPGAVGYFKGRRSFGGTTNKPQNLWLTRPGTESNMSYSIPTRDDDRIAVRLTSLQNNVIRHLVPLNDLIVLTSGAEWRIATQNSDALTPTSIDPRPQDYIGASNVRPVVTSGALLYAQDRGGRIREMRYSWEQSGYKTGDVSIMAPHLFDDYTIKSMCYSRAPHQLLWAVRDDGQMLGLTYVPEHEVLAWHHHDTDGEFEAVVSVPEGNEDAVYAVVKRTINARTVRYIERLHSRQFDELEDCFFVDSGLTYDGAAATTITGLYHLVGETVSILADGAVHPREVVDASGTVTLDQEASKVHIGLPYTSDLETLPLAFEAQALGQGTKKNVNKAYLRIVDSSGVMAGPSFDRLVEMKQRTDEPYGSPPALVSGEFPITLLPSWGNDAGICLRQENPLPVTLLAMTLDVAIGG